MNLRENGIRGEGVENFPNLKKIIKKISGVGSASEERYFGP